MLLDIVNFYGNPPGVERSVLHKRIHSQAYHNLKDYNLLAFPNTYKDSHNPELKLLCQEFGKKCVQLWHKTYPDPDADAPVGAVAEL